MNKLVKKILIVALFLGMFGVNQMSNAGARNIGSLNGIWINNLFETNTPSLIKTVWNGWYVVNLSGTANTSRVRSQLQNSNGEKKSQWNLTTGGDRDNYYTINCKEGYYYHLALLNDKWGRDDIYGTWSPDHY